MLLSTGIKCTSALAALLGAAASESSEGPESFDTMSFSGSESSTPHLPRKLMFCISPQNQEKTLVQLLEVYIKEKQNSEYAKTAFKHVETDFYKSCGVFLADTPAQSPFEMVKSICSSLATHLAHPQEHTVCMNVMINTVQMDPDVKYVFPLDASPQAVLTHLCALEKGSGVDVLSVRNIKEFVAMVDPTIHALIYRILWHHARFKLYMHFYILVQDKKALLEAGIPLEDVNRIGLMYKNMKIPESSCVRYMQLPILYTLAHNLIASMISLRDQYFVNVLKALRASDASPKEQILHITQVSSEFCIKSIVLCKDAGLKAELAMKGASFHTIYNWGIFFLPAE
ncbi:uncharacterized protein NEMAJ01_1846 [Nematocida major]|uniref:uncharacterized protein n=1 Tax=Nematocida major TaxID=1912982 RepID=UPI0020078E88|nr:uncharacterized protein NEMAJ01_1846 [Nematocida major]KAH9386950.1 hypothetical protein NEMAJ01_1846 [Nematocida major]